MISLAWKIPRCLSANRNRQLMLRCLHWCFSWTALFSANQNRVIFSCLLLALKYSLWLEWTKPCRMPVSRANVEKKRLYRFYYVKRERPWSVVSWHWLLASRKLFCGFRSTQRMYSNGHTGTHKSEVFSVIERDSRSNHFHKCKRIDERSYIWTGKKDIKKLIIEIGTWKRFRPEGDSNP